MRQGVGDEVDDEVRTNVAQYEITTNEAVLEVFGELRKIHQQTGWHGLQRHAPGIVLVHLQTSAHRLGMTEAGPDATSVCAGERGGDLLAEVAGNAGSEDVSLLCMRTCFEDAVGDRLALLH